MSEIDLKAQLSDLNFSKLQTIIHDNTGITIGDSRKSMLVSRLRSRLRETGAPDFKGYIAQVQSDPDELQQLINRVTTNKTYFYRTPRIWEHFLETPVNEFVHRKAKRPMRIWSAAASTGEEAHTIGVLLEEERCRHTDFDYSILGTDISSRVLEVAEAGRYSEVSVADMRKHHPTLFMKYFEDVGSAEFQVEKSVRSRISFKRHNLQGRLQKPTKFDVIFLRNVLIYFTQEDQENILSNVHHALAPSGYLYIGESESLTRLNTDFVMAAPMIYQSKSGQV